MPICLLLQGKGTFMSPFMIDETDPMFTLLITYIKSKCDINYFNSGDENDGHNFPKNLSPILLTSGSSDHNSKSPA